MDSISAGSGNQTTITTKQLKRLGKGLRPATVKGLQSICEDTSSTDWPVYHCRIAHHRLIARVNHNNRNRKAVQNSKRWMIDSEDGAALARSKTWLPSDGCRQKPRLERQEAFRVPETVYISDFIENDADLYRLGLLYDDEQARGSGFDLNDIVHSDLIYSVRPVKRIRKGTSRAHKPDSCVEIGSVYLGQTLASTLEAQSAVEDEAAQHYPTPAPTPRHMSDVVTNNVMRSKESLAAATNIWPQDDQSCVDASSECSEDSSHDWALVANLKRAESDQRTLVEDLDEGTTVTTGPWVMLGET